MEEEAIKKPASIQRRIMPCRLDCRVRIEMEDHICALFAREDVPHAHVREIREETHVFDIWCTLPCDMMTLMDHVVP